MQKLTIIGLSMLLALLQFRLWLGDGGLLEVFRFARAVEVQKQENARLRERNRLLLAEVKDFKEGLAAVEERARSELGMIKEGEIFYQIVEP
ncbi:MAG: cell division protein FtsB [Gammaproteobacteria bacterium]|nr:MAG: cell division protein FtsB [Gammaproteobacteria bacterium]